MRKKPTNKPQNNKGDPPKSNVSPSVNQQSENHTNSEINRNNRTQSQGQNDQDQAISRAEAKQQTELISNAIITASDKISSKNSLREWLMVIVNAGLLGITIWIFLVNKDGIKDSVELGRQTLEQTQRNFEKDNQPYLVANDITAPKILENTDVELEFKIFNYGKQPIKLENGGNTLQFIPIRDSIAFNNDPMSYLTQRKTFIEYIANANPKRQIFKQRALPTQVYWGFAHGQYLVYFIGRYEYINNITDKNRQYDFVIKFNYGHFGPSWSMIKNDNYDIK